MNQQNEERGDRVVVPLRPAPGPPDDEETKPLAIGRYVDPDTGPSEPQPAALIAAKLDAARPAIPLWLTDRATRRATLAWSRRYAVHIAQFHIYRTPLYGWRIVLRSVRGTGVVIAKAWSWLWDRETLHVRRDLLDPGKPSELQAASYTVLRREQKKTIRGRVVLVVFGSIVGWLGYNVGAHFWPLEVPDLKLTLLGVWILLTALAGRRPGQPIVAHAVISTPGVAKLTQDVVIRGLGSLAIPAVTAAITKGPGISFVSPITRDGPGWKVDIDLPYGVTAMDVIDRREKLSSGLRRPLGCVWPEAVRDEHDGRLSLWVGDQDLSKGKVTWSLTRAGKADLFGTIPFGADQRGRPIAIPLIFNSMLIAAMPRQGKTFALRVLLLGCALDPTVELRIFELKGTGDLEPLAKVAHRYASGAADDATLSACMDSLREVYAELERRADAIKKLPKTVVPENKVTRELANRRKAGLHPIVLPIDECQELFTHPDFKEEAEKLCVGIMKRGPALGIMLILATQRPDKDSLPKSISANAGLRFCLRVMGQVENDMVLGTSMYKVGVRATQFTPEDLGIGWLVGATKYPRIVKAAFVDNPGADKIADRARAAKVAAGWLTGHAAGEVETGPSHNVVDDLLMVFGDEDKAHNEVLVSRLAQAWPDRYTGWTPADLTRALKPYGVPVGQTWGAPVDGGKPTNRQGINRADLIAARR